jgi:hypothetical protein
MRDGARVCDVQLLVALVDAELCLRQVTAVAVGRGEVDHPGEDRVVVGVVHAPARELVKRHQVVEVAHHPLGPVSKCACVGARVCVCVCVCVCVSK